MRFQSLAATALAVAPAGCAPPPSSTPVSGPLALVLSKQSSLNGKTMKLDCAITNASSAPVAFWMWNCSYDQQFRVTSDDSSIRESGMKECSRNFVEKFSLPPGGSKSVALTVSRTLKPTNLFPKFRVIFHPSHPEYRDGRIQPPLEQRKEDWKHDPMNQDFPSDEISF
jgi:hypothetical protein